MIQHNPRYNKEIKYKKNIIVKDIYKDKNQIKISKKQINQELSIKDIIHQLVKGIKNYKKQNNNKC